jgi:hypothetical protein
MKILKEKTDITLGYYLGTIFIFFGVGLSLTSFLIGIPIIIIGYIFLFIGL